MNSSFQALPIHAQVPAKRGWQPLPINTAHRAALERLHEGTLPKAGAQLTPDELRAVFARPLAATSQGVRKALGLQAGFAPFDVAPLRG